jgi:hypothetical protein
MPKVAAIAAQVRSVCDFLHQYEGLEKRQLRRIQTAGFYNAFAAIPLRPATRKTRDSFSAPAMMKGCCRSRQ